MEQRREHAAGRTFPGESRRAAGIALALTLVVALSLAGVAQSGASRRPGGSRSGASGRAVTHPAHPAPPAPRLANSEQPPVGASQPSPAVQTAPSIAASVVAAAPTPGGRGFWVAWSNGLVTTAGNAHWYGDLARTALSRPIVGIAATPTGRGYWLLGADGGVFSFGDAVFHGSTGNLHLSAPALQMVSTSDGRGYDFVAGDGGIFTFGDAAFHGSTGHLRLARPVVGMAGTPNGGGYWLVATDGGIFAFGNARFYGSTGALHLTQPVVGMAPTLHGQGYWLLAADGGVFAFGDATFHGSGAGRTGGSRAVGIVATGDGKGYWIVLSDGRVLSNGDAAPVVGPTTAATPKADPNYSFEVTNSAGVPARWNPCESVHYAVVVAGAPRGYASDVSNDIAQVSRATGISFVYDGAFATTASVPASSKLTISWVRTLSGGDLVGLTTYWYYATTTYTPQVISAQVQLLSSLIGGAGPDGEQPVLLHELGHAMGLGHTPSIAEVMNPVDQGHPTYQAGDLNGLWHVGSAQGCAGFYR